MGESVNGQFLESPSVHRCSCVIAVQPPQAAIAASYRVSLICRKRRMSIMDWRPDKAQGLKPVGGILGVRLSADTGAARHCSACRNSPTAAAMAAITFRFTGMTRPFCVVSGLSSAPLPLRARSALGFSTFQSPTEEYSHAFWPGAPRAWCRALPELQ